MATDITVKFKDKTYHVPEGFTVTEYKDVLASQFPEAATAELIEDKENEFTLKTTYKGKG